MSLDPNDATLLSVPRPAANLIVRQGPQIGIMFPITGNRIIIGREETCNVILQDPEVSRRHCELFWEEGAYFIQDLGSTNGIFVNGTQITGPARLNSGDNIGVGQTQFVLELETESPPAEADYELSAALSAPASQQAPQPQSGFTGAKKWIPIGCGCLVLLCFCGLASLIGLDIFDFIDLGFPIP